MFAPEEQTFEAWMKPGVDAFNSWISFFPVAPLFGVDWRFAEAFGSSPLSASTFNKPKPSREKSPKDVPSDADPLPVAYARVSPETAEKVDLPSEPPKDVAMPAEAAVDKPAGTDEKPKGLLAKAPKDADDLKLIKGVGPGLEKQLNDLGIYRFRQLAKFKDADLTWIDDNLNSFKGRCFRDDWVGQAKALLK